MSDGIDRYEAERIAEDCAHRAAENAKRELGYDVERLADEMRSLRQELRGELEQRRTQVAELWDELAVLRSIVERGGGGRMPNT